MCGFIQKAGISMMGQMASFCCLIALTIDLSASLSSLTIGLWILKVWFFGILQKDKCSVLILNLHLSYWFLAAQGSEAAGNGGTLTPSISIPLFKELSLVYTTEVLIIHNKLRTANVKLSTWSETATPTISVKCKLLWMLEICNKNSKC